MKFKLTEKQQSALLIILASVLVLYFKETLVVLSSVFSAVSPLLFGLLLALIMRPPLCFFEGKILGGLNAGFRTKRILSLLLAYIAFSIALFFALYVLVPQIAISISNFAEKLSSLASGLNAFLRKGGEIFGASETVISELEKMIYSGMKKLGEYILTNLPNFASVAFVVWGRVASFCFAIIFSIYILFDKEKLKDVFEKLCKKLLKSSSSDRLIKLQEEVTEGFANFFSGQIVEALILGSLCFGGMLILRLPYAPLISTIMMITAVVPLIGAFVGTVPSMVIILLVSPIQAVIFLIFILLLQMVEGNLIYPYVVGSKVELPPLVILFAVLAGGNLFGVIGVLIAVPTTSVGYRYLMTYLGK